MTWPFVNLCPFKSHAISIKVGLSHTWHIFVLECNVMLKTSHTLHQKTEFVPVLSLDQNVYKTGGKTWTLGVRHECPFSTLKWLLLHNLGKVLFNVFISCSQMADFFWSPCPVSLKCYDTGLTHFYTYVKTNILFFYENEVSYLLYLTCWQQFNDNDFMCWLFWFK